MSVLSETVSGLCRFKGFLPDEVDPDAINAVLGAARVAPSADNVQMWRFVKVTEPGRKKEILEAVPSEKRTVMSGAPVLIAALGEPWFIRGSRREQPFFMIDVPIAVSHMLLQAAELGLACALELAIDEEKVKHAVGAGKDFRAVAIIAIGKPAEIAQQTRRAG